MCPTEGVGAGRVRHDLRDRDVHCRTRQQAEFIRRKIDRPLEDRELLPECQVLGGQISLVSQEAPEEDEQRPDDAHFSRLLALSRPEIVPE